MRKTKRLADTQRRVGPMARLVPVTEPLPLPRHKEKEMLQHTKRIAMKARKRGEGGEERKGETFNLPKALEERAEEEERLRKKRREMEGAVKRRETSTSMSLGDLNAGGGRQSALKKKSLKGSSSLPAIAQ